MTAYYNECDPYAAQWLRNLIAAGLIAPGDVDDRKIEEVRPDDLRGYTQCHFFAGIGGWSAALRLAGWSDERPVWTGSCPCQPFSTAGNGKGVSDPRHLWPIWLPIIAKCRPTIVFGEQSANAIRHNWISIVQRDVESENYACGYAVLGAHSVGATHIRQRLWWTAVSPNADRAGLSRSYEYGDFGAQKITSAWGEFTRVHAEGSWRTWLSESGTGPLIDGVPGRVGRTRAYGNAIVPQVAATFIRAVMEGLS